MSERKVLNKYYPPDFDPSKLPRVKRENTNQFTIRLMAPFNMRCETCGEYIYKGRTFNARKEDVIGKTFLGTQVYRFYINCANCSHEITFLTDPENQDYAMECGAIRNFEIQSEQIKCEKVQIEEENRMDILEKRMINSKQEIIFHEQLEDIKELNSKNASFDLMTIMRQRERVTIKQQQEDDEEEIKRMLRRNVDKDIVMNGNEMNEDPRANKRQKVEASANNTAKVSSRTKLKLINEKDKKKKIVSMIKKKS